MTLPTRQPAIDKEHAACEISNRLHALMAGMEVETCIRALSITISQAYCFGTEDDRAVIRWEVAQLAAEAGKPGFNWAALAARLPSCMRRPS